MPKRAGEGKEGAGGGEERASQQGKASRASRWRAGDGLNLGTWRRGFFSLLALPPRASPLFRTLVGTRKSRLQNKTRPRDDDSVLG